MANSRNSSASAAEPTAPGVMAIVSPAVGWLVPGAGHLVQKRYGRGVLLLVAIAGLYICGLLMQGHVYPPNGGEVLEILGFICDLGAGGLYIVSRALDWGQAPAANAVADYGTKFVFVAGLLNLIAVADAYHIAIGKKQ
jgi:hypothetical protein